MDGCLAIKLEDMFPGRDKGSGDIVEFPGVGRRWTAACFRAAHCVTAGTGNDRTVAHVMMVCSLIAAPGCSP